MKNNIRNIKTYIPRISAIKYGNFNNTRKIIDNIKENETDFHKPIISIESKEKKEEKEAIINKPILVENEDMINANNVIVIEEKKEVIPNTKTITNNRKKRKNN